MSIIAEVVKYNPSQDSRLTLWLYMWIRISFLNSQFKKSHSLEVGKIHLDFCYDILK